MFNKLKSNKKTYVLFLLGIIFVVSGLLSYIFFFKYEEDFKKNENSFLDGVKTYFDMYPNKLPKVGSYTQVNLEDMYQSLYVETLYVPGNNKICDERSFVRVINEEGIYRYVVYLKCGNYKSKSDVKPPVINLNGDDNIIIGINSTYEELGVASVTDNNDNSIDVEKVVIDGKIDTSKPGSYKITYKVFDSNFNAGVKERVVTVLDTLNQYIINDTNDGIYRGKDSNNYLLYSGMLYRIVKINEDDTVKIISENVISNIDNVGGNVSNWLNDYYYNYISNKDYVYDLSKWCVGSYENNCSHTGNYRIGLLTVTEYNDTLLNGKSYLDTGLAFLLANNKDGNSSIAFENKISNEYGNMLLPIRPVLNLDSGLFVISGDGTFEKPYKLNDYNYGKENDLLSTRLVGEYINYSGYKMLISDVLENGVVKAIMVDNIMVSNNNKLVTVSFNDGDNVKFDIKDTNNYGYSINTEFLNYFNSSYMINGKFINVLHDSTKKYNEYAKEEYFAKLSIPLSYEMFSGALTTYDGPTSLYLLHDYSSDSGKIFMVNSRNGLGFELVSTAFNNYGVRGVMYLKSGLKIKKGTGRVNDPYYIQ